MAQRRGDRPLSRHALTGQDGVQYSSSESETSAQRSASSASSVGSDCSASDEDIQRWVRSAARSHQYLACKCSASRPLPGVTGLENLGNTCYMNAVLQVLAHTQNLVNYVVSGLFREDLNRQSATRGEVAEEVAQLLTIIWSGKFRFVSPHRLRAVIGAQRGDFGGTRPHDAHEYILLLLEWLHDDLNVAPEPSGAAPLPTPEGLSNFEAAERTWRQFRRANDSIVVNLFHGQQKSTLLCTACGFESATFETFSLLSLPLAAGASTSRSSLYHCLEQYVHGDLINGWTCPKCRRRHDVYKKFDIWRMPPVLILHLKRFSFGGSTMRKAHGHVSFPLRDLDFSQLSIGPHPETHSLVYDLYAVVEHHGSPHSGHYTAFCFNQPAARWFFVDDVMLKETAAAKVKDASAYMLCYAARDVA
ncbi:ubiquitin carboxyl-terminal hydrolase 11-like [Pollicipes pollicipes]|uniref:ubiquitin carboxyl-terminal hydrolase 11-like n=1 Tax=Pollicipes pollicipes TaxID=41117 RepID=UPI00188564A4|nr:ubiquitin carboxyl-terminal hydrolase 11-like [Pollicipes pollicipes]